jgi:hypothetical protein
MRRTGTESIATNKPRYRIMSDVSPDEFWIAYGKIGFDCITEGCHGRVYIEPTEATCVICETEYNVEITVARIDD